MRFDGRNQSYLVVLCGEVYLHSGSSWLGNPTAYGTKPTTYIAHEDRTASIIPLPETFRFCDEYHAKTHREASELPLKIT